MATKKSEMSQDTKTLITILLLIFVYPVGLIMMFVWMDWKWWIKLLVVLIPLLPFLMLMSFVFAIIFSSVNPSAQLNRAADVAARNEAAQMLLETTKYYASHNAYPWGNKVGYEVQDAAREVWYTKLTTDNPDLKNMKNRMRVIQNSDGVEICYQSMSLQKEVCLPE